MKSSLEKKLALLVWYLQETGAKRRGTDVAAFNSLMDDLEINEWMERMRRNNQIQNTMFTQSK